MVTWNKEKNEPPLDVVFAAPASNLFQHPPSIIVYHLSVDVVHCGATMARCASAGWQEPAIEIIGIFGP